MKNKKIFALACLSALSVAGLTGCGNKIEAGGEHVIQVRVFKGGYGDAWLKEVIEKYEAVNPNHNRVEIIESSAQVTEASKQEIKSVKDNQIDLYFLNGININETIDSSKSALGRGSTDALLECLDDVYNSPAIGYDGKKETKTIKERLSDGYFESCQYHGVSYPKWQDQTFVIPWADAMTGLFVNPAVLQQYNLEIPLTTNELINCVNTIAATSKTTGVYPYSWAGSNASGYWSYLYETWFAQYSGKEAFDNFVKCTPGGDDSMIEEDGWKVYEDQGILESLKIMFEILDINNSRSGDLDHMQAQNEFIQGKAAFMVSGDWMVGEMKNSSEQYFDKAKDILMIQAPILSSIGSNNNLTDAQLHDVIAAIDAGKTDAQVQEAVPAATAKAVAKIRDARSIHDGIGVAHLAFIPSYADAKDAAKEFLRYLYSEDGCRSFRNNTYANLPLSYEVKDTDTNTTYQQSLDKFYNVAKPQMVSIDAQLNEVRNAANLYPFNCSSWSHPSTYKAIINDKYKTHKLSAQLMYEQELAYVRDSWSTYMGFVSF